MIFKTSTFKNTKSKNRNGFKIRIPTINTVTDDDGWTRTVKKTFKPKDKAFEPERERVTVVPWDSSAFRLPEKVDSSATPLPKIKILKNGTLRDLARGRECLLQAPQTTFHDPQTTVLCHGNWSDMEKGGSRKAQDFFSVWGCSECHSWLDQRSGPTYAEKRLTFLVALGRQLDAWQVIASSQKEPERYRRAAQWALDEFRLSGLDLATKTADCASMIE